MAMLWGNLFQFLPQSRSMKQYLAAMIFALVIYQATTEWTQSARIGDVDFHPDFTEEEIQEGIDRAHQQGLSVVMCWLTETKPGKKDTKTYLSLKRID